MTLYFLRPLSGERLPGRVAEWCGLMQLKSRDIAESGERPKKENPAIAGPCRLLS
ncbi:hypothetical protein [Ectopseudomonas hydrolytica]|jgi:hypothetical protein|uniref:hypothetical protein n=1 Tax=Ectopseudomonas hydrolytica TaxID=2493633 RepID=UPI0020B66527|nr:hypothetical protein [Pseudomonas hydrolytica]UTH31182.1 hypothetical protein NLY38_22560 [Pseudomonas hydrolytica]